MTYVCVYVGTLALALYSGSNDTSVFIWLSNVTKWMFIIWKPYEYRAVPHAALARCSYNGSARP